MEYTSLESVLTNSILKTWEKIILFIPTLLSALIILLIGFIVASIVKHVIVKFLNFIKLQALSDKIKLTDLLKEIKSRENINELIGDFFYWVVVVIFLLPTFQVIGLEKVSDILNQILAYIPNALVAVFIVLVGILLANLLGNVVKAAAAGFGTSLSGVLASIVRYTIITFVILAGLVQLGVAVYFLNTLFTGFVAMIALAGGLAFGLGGKDAASGLITTIKKDFTIKSKK